MPHTRSFSSGFEISFPERTTWRTEVPIPITGDLRAWDAQCTLSRAVVGIEAEMRLFDVQALDRRIALKRRDAGPEIVILLVADTKGNRRHLADRREVLRANVPLDTRAVLAALRRADRPEPVGSSCFNLDGGFRCLLRAPDDRIGDRRRLGQLWVVDSGVWRLIQPASARASVGSGFQ
jgi:hypothetical protein